MGKVSLETPTPRLQKCTMSVQAVSLSACLSVVPHNISDGGGGGGWPEKLPSPFPISQAQTIHVAREISQDLINERSRDREKRKEGRRVERRREVEKLG